MNPRKITALSIAWLALVLVAPVGISAAEQLARSSDKEVKATIDSIAKLEKSFDRSLDRKFKNSVLRSSTGEVAISAFLTDLAASIADLQKRVKGNYSASSEVKSVLVRSSKMHTYVRQNPSMKGADEWDALADALNQLAVSYGATFPLAEGAVVRRIGDTELVDAANNYGKFATQFEKVLKKDGGKVKELKPSISAAVTSLKSFKKLSKDLASRIKSSKPASAVARQLLDEVGVIDGIVALDGMPETVRQAWAEGTVYRRKIEMAFGIPDEPEVPVATSLGTN